MPSRSEILQDLREACRRLGAGLEAGRTLQNGREFLATRDGGCVRVILYHGKKGETLYIPEGQGRLGAELREWLCERRTPASAWRSWIGSDEAGKGDFFGPLVVAAVRVSREQAGEIVRWGARDSKAMSTGRVRAVAVRVRALPHAIVRLDPGEYNRMYRARRNVNAVLGWAHAEAIRRVLERSPAEAAIVDRFGNERHLLEEWKGSPLHILQRVRAESDPAVAAASILARDEFVRSIEALSDRFQVRLPRGAGGPVMAAGREFVRRFGKGKLAEVAKVHFRTAAAL